jgi:hypothetical protein
MEKNLKMLENVQLNRKIGQIQNWANPIGQIQKRRRPGTGILLLDGDRVPGSFF